MVLCEKLGEVFMLQCVERAIHDVTYVEVRHFVPGRQNPDLCSSISPICKRSDERSRNKRK